MVPEGGFPRNEVIEYLPKDVFTSLPGSGDVEEDPGTHAYLALYFEGSTQRPDPLRHCGQPDASMPCLQILHFAHLEAPAVVLHQELHPVVLLFGDQGHQASLGMPGDVIHGFLEDSIDTDLIFQGEALAQVIQIKEAFYTVTLAEAHQSHGQT